MSKSPSRPDTGGTSSELPANRPGRDHLSKAEIRKDAVQEGIEATAIAVHAVSGAVITAVKDVAGALGGLATDLFEIRDGVRRARDQHSD